MGRGLIRAESGGSDTESRLHVPGRNGARLLQRHAPLTAGLSHAPGLRATATERRIEARWLPWADTRRMPDEPTTPEVERIQSSFEAINCGDFEPL
jgi:hypothetical protein